MSQKYLLISFMMNPKHFLSVANRCFYFARGSLIIALQKYLALFGTTLQVSTNLWEKINQCFDTFTEPRHLL